MIGFIPQDLIENQNISCSAKVMFAALTCGAAVEVDVDALDELRNAGLVSRNKDGYRVIVRASHQTTLTAPAKAKESTEKEVDPWVAKVVDQFYGMEHTTTPTKSQRSDACTVVRLTLKDMGGDSEVSRARLARILRFAVEDDGNGTWSGWKNNLKSLVALRRVGRNGLKKWETIEGQMPQESAPKQSYNANQWEAYAQNG